MILDYTVQPSHCAWVSQSFCGLSKHTWQILSKGNGHASYPKKWITFNLYCNLLGEWVYRLNNTRWKQVNHVFLRETEGFCHVLKAQILIETDSMAHSGPILSVKKPCWRTC